MERAFVVFSPTGGQGAVYGVLQGGSGDEVLTGLEAPELEGRAGLHEGEERGGRRVMEPTDSVPVPAGTQTLLRPGGYHGMLEGVAAPPSPGDSVTLRFLFRGAGSVRVTAEVVSYADLERLLGPGD